MNRKKRNREVFSEHGYWQSYSDMLAALLLFFILIIAVTMAVYRQKTEDLKKTEVELKDAKIQLELTLEDLKQSKKELEISNEELKLSLAQLQEAYDQRALTEEELDAAYLEVESARKELAATQRQLQDIVGVRTDIIKELQAAFDEQSMTVDSQTGSITFSSDVLFRYNSATLTLQSQEVLKAVIPKYLSVLLQDQYKDYIAEIIIEGHTDTVGGYQSNMELSLSRANAVAKFCLDETNGLDASKIEQLQGVLTVNGRSYSAPVYKEAADENNVDAGQSPATEAETPVQKTFQGSGVIVQEIERENVNQEKEYLDTESDSVLTEVQVDMASSRRVEIKFRLKEEEMIEKLSQLITQESVKPEPKKSSEGMLDETDKALNGDITTAEDTTKKETVTEDVTKKENITEAENKTLNADRTEAEDATLNTDKTEAENKTLNADKTEAENTTLNTDRTEAEDTTLNVDNAETVREAQGAGAE